MTDRRPRVARRPRGRRPGAPRRSTVEPPGTPGEGRMVLRMRPLDLNLSPKDPSMAASPPSRDRAARRKKPAGTRVSEAQQVKARVDRWLGEDRATTNASHGRGHPALFDLLRRADRNFGPTLATIPEHMRRPRRAYYRAWQAAVKQFNKMYSALPYDSHATGEVVLPLKMLAGNRMINEAVIKNGSQQLATEICVLAHAGSAPAITSQKSSGLGALDRLARGALTRAFPADPLPAGLPRCTACYRFGVSFGRTLPTPYNSCVFTGLFTKFKCIDQGGEFLLKKVSLVKIYLPPRAAGAPR